MLDDVLNSRFSETMIRMAKVVDGIEWENSYRELLGNGCQLMEGALEMCQSSAATHRLFVITNQFFEDIFKTIIPLTSQVTMQATMQADEEVKDLLEYCEIPRSRSEMQEFMKFSDRENFRKDILNHLIKGGLSKLTIPTKPTSPKQKYHSKKR